MTKPHVNPLDLVNDSGYPFQLLVEDVVKKGTQTHGWSVFSREKPWRDQQSGDEGYIDLLLAKEHHRMVIECKSPKEPQDWIFLIEEGTEPLTTRVCCLLLEYQKRAENDVKSLIVWRDLDLNQVSFESDFCVREQDDRNKPLLERQSSTLLQSTECLAEEELRLQEGNAHQNTTYIPVIVTTAQLQACIFKASSVGISSGKIPKGVATFQKIPYIRFRKTILTKYRTFENPPQDLAEAGRLQQRTILVIQGQDLSKLLCWV